MILRKYLAWLSSTATLLVLGWMTVPKGFAGIGDWLGPMLGPAFRPELYLAFLMFGPALTYTPLLLTWVAAGLMGGFFSRGVWRSLAAGTLSTITIILVMVGNGLIIIASLGGLGNITGGFSGLNIPPPPPGLTLAEIVNAPLVGQVIQAVASGGPVNPISIVEILLVNFLVNRVIHAVSFIASGVLFSKISQRQHQPVRVAHPVYAPAPVPNPVPAPTPQVQKGPEPQTPAPTPNPTLEVKKDKEREDPSPGPSAGKVAVVLFILALSSSALLVPVSPTHIFQASPSSGQPTGEQLAVNLQKDGTLRMSYSTNLTSLPGVPSDYSRQEFQGLAGAFIFAFNGSVDLGQNGSGSGGGSLSTIASLLPPNGFLAVYTVTEQATGKVRADVLASEFQQGFAVTLTPAVSMMLPSFGGQSGAVYLAIYSGDGTVESVGISVLNLVQTTGVGSILSSPRVFVSNFGAEAGFLNLNFQNSTGTPSLTPGVQITADLTQWGNFYGRGTFTLGLREILGSQGTIGPSSIAGTTSIQLGFPENSTVTGFGPSNATLDTIQGQLSYSMNASSTPVQNVYVTFTNVFPQKIVVSRQLEPSSPVTSGTTVKEHITVTNLGNESIRGAIASEKRLFQTYSTLQLLSTSENVSLGDIAPQASAEATLTFKVSSDGFYTLPGTEIAYTDQGQAISKSTGPTYLQSSFSLLVYVERLVQGTSPYSYLFLFLAVLPLIIQTPRSLRRSKPGVQSRPVQVKDQSPNW